MDGDQKTLGHTDGPLAAGAGVNGTAAAIPDTTPAPVSAHGCDSLAEVRLASLRMFRQPRVEELEELQLLTDYLKWRNRRSSRVPEVTA